MDPMQDRLRIDPRVSGVIPWKKPSTMTDRVFLRSDFLGTQNLKSGRSAARDLPILRLL